MRVIASLLLAAALLIAAPGAAPSTVQAAIAPPATGYGLSAPTRPLDYVGRLTIPGIGLYQAVYSWGCRGGTIPNLVLTWDCAGRNNTYLLGHAWGVFKPYHDAYRRGLLRAGLTARLIDETGHAHTYRIMWVRLVTSSFSYAGMSGGTWAWNGTATPSLTLQTCWGAFSRYRLVTRFTLVS